MDENYDPDVVTEFENTTWSRCAERYTDTFAGLTNETFPLLLSTVAIGTGSNILEIGSGPGNVSKLLSGTGATVTGIDFSVDMVEIAQKRYPEITFLQADAEQLPFDDNSFDVVIANFVVHHLARPEKVFREVSRVLKHWGCFSFIVWGAPEEQSSFGCFFGAYAEFQDMEELPHGPLFGITDDKVYQDMFAQAGLVDGQISIHNVKWNASSIDPIVNGFSDWGNMDLLPKDTQENIIKLTTENSKLYQSNEGYAFPHQVLRGFALKG